MKPRWTCPRCGDEIPLELEITSDKADGRLCNNDKRSPGSVTLRVRLDEADLADVAAHVWRHEQ